MNFIERFEDYGIDGINMRGTTEQRAICPECRKRKGGTNSKDLAVNIEKGVWECWSANCGWTGNLKKQTVKTGKVIYRKIESKAVKLEENNYKYFETRGITREVVQRNQITKDKRKMPPKDLTDEEVAKGVIPPIEWKIEPVICFNYYLGSELVNIKYRTIDKRFMQEKDAAKIFYKINDIVDQTECIITEGEFDALSFEVAGYINAVSVPDGAPNPIAKDFDKKFSYLDNCSEYFENIKKIYIATDTDAAGIRLREELARRLGKIRCLIVHFPDDCKDANEALIKYGKAELVKCIENATPYPIEGVHYANEKINEMDEIWEYGYPAGVKTRWRKFNEHITFYESIVTTIIGIPTHGKSNFSDALMVELACTADWRFAIFSPENGKTEIHLHRLCEIYIGKPLLPNQNNRMTQEEMHIALDFINDHFFFVIPKDEDFKLQNILDAVQSLVIKRGINGYIIDPWNSVEHDMGGDSETEYIRKTLNKITYYGRNHGLATFLVVHPSKMRRIKNDLRHEIPTLYDGNGSAHWYNKTENGICIYRDYSKDMEATKQTLVIIQKVKHKFIGRTGMVKFGFDSSCQRYYEIENTESESAMVTEKNYEHYQTEREPEDVPF